MTCSARLSVGAPPSTIRVRAPVGPARALAGTLPSVRAPHGGGRGCAICALGDVTWVYVLRVMVPVDQQKHCVAGSEDQQCQCRLAKVVLAPVVCVLSNTSRRALCKCLL
ncbi:hypothetical protein BC834DRAFT_694108 [Gloeopeniophorella convolvens]|nr:hypothetical protein BC834DRAFT_694108 [Gloeopeniophorella convolvens]